MTDEVESPLTDDEARTLIKLLVRYCNHDLDQWGNWHLNLPWGDVYVTITNSLPSDWPAEAFHQVWPLPPTLAPTGESAMGRQVGAPTLPPKNNGD